jgi:hypothetical protein
MPVHHVGRHFITGLIEKSLAARWIHDGAIRDRIDDTVTDVVLVARAGRPAKSSRTVRLQRTFACPPDPASDYYWWRRRDHGKLHARSSGV